MNGENTNGPLAVTSLLSSPLKGKGQGEELGKGLSARGGSIREREQVHGNSELIAYAC